MSYERALDETLAVVGGGLPMQPVRSSTTAVYRRSPKQPKCRAVVLPMKQPIKPSQTMAPHRPTTVNSNVRFQPQAHSTSQVKTTMIGNDVRFKRAMATNTPPVHQKGMKLRGPGRPPKFAKPSPVTSKASTATETETLPASSVNNTKTYTFRELHVQQVQDTETTTTDNAVGGPVVVSKVNKDPVLYRVEGILNQCTRGLITSERALDEISKAINANRRRADTKHACTQTATVVNMDYARKRWQPMAAFPPSSIRSVHRPRNFAPNNPKNTLITIPPAPMLSSPALGMESIDPDLKPPRISNDECELLAMLGLTVNLRPMLIVRTSRKDSKAYTFMHTGKVVEGCMIYRCVQCCSRQTVMRSVAEASNAKQSSAALDKKLLFVLEGNQLPCMSECQRINAGHRDSCRPAELISILSQQAVRNAAKDILDNGTELWTAHKTAMRAMYERLQPLGYATAVILTSLPIICAPQVLTMYRDNRRRRVQQLRTQLAESPTNAQLLQLLNDAQADVEQANNHENERMYREMELHARCAVDPFVVNDNEAVAEPDLEYNVVGVYNERMQLNQIDVGSASPLAMERVRAYWINRLRAHAPAFTAKSKKKRAANAQTMYANDDDECIEYSNIGLTSNLQPLLIIRSRREPSSAFTFYYKPDKQNGEFRRMLWCSRCIQEIERHRRTRKNMKHAYGTDAIPMDDDWNRLRCVYVNANRELPCARACEDIDNGHCSTCQPMPIIEIICQQMVRRVGADMHKTMATELTDKWELHKQQARQAYEQALAAGYEKQQILRMLPWFSSHQVQLIYNNFARTALYSAVTPPIPAVMPQQLTERQIKDFDRAENEHRNSEEPYSVDDTAVDGTVIYTDYLQQQVDLDLNTVMRRKHTTVRMDATDGTTTSEAADIKPIVLNQVHNNTIVVAGCPIPDIDEQSWLDMQADAFELTSAGCVVPFPNHPDIFVCLVNRTNVNVQRLNNGLLRCECVQFEQWQQTLCVHTLAVAVFLNTYQQYLHNVTVNLNKYYNDNDVDNNSAIVQQQQQHDDQQQQIVHFDQPIDGQQVEEELNIGTVEWRIILWKATEFVQRNCIKQLPGDEQELFLVTVDQQPFTVSFDGVSEYSCNCDQFDALRIVCMHTMAVAQYLGRIHEYKRLIEPYVDRIPLRPSDIIEELNFDGTLIPVTIEQSGQIDQGPPSELQWYQQ